MLGGGHERFPLQASGMKRRVNSGRARNRVEAHPDRELGRGDELAGVDLLAVGGLHARDLEAPVGADDREAVRFHDDDLAHFAGDALRILGGQRLGVENLHGLAVERRPGAGRGVAPADQRIDLAPGFRPVDARVFGTAAPLIGRERLVLLEARRLAGLHEVDRLQHGLHAHWEEPVEIDAAERVGRRDRRLLLHEHVAGIEAVVGPEDREPGFLLAENDRPVDRARPAISGQQRGMILDRAVRRDVEELLRHEQGDEGHHLQVGLERLELLPHFRLAVGGGLVNRQLGGERRFLQRVGFLARLLRRHIDGDHFIAAFEQRLEHRLAEGLLAVDDDPHWLFPPHTLSSSYTARAGRRRVGKAKRAHRAWARRALRAFAHPTDRRQAAAAAGLSGAVVAPDALIAATSSAE